MLVNAPRIFRHPRVAHLTRAFIGALLALAALVASSQSAPATVVAPLMTWNAASDFSAVNNPSGAWSYGWSSDRLSPFNPYTTTTTSAGLDVWTTSTAGDLTPGVFYNPTSLAIFPNQSNFFPPGELVLHPGSAGQNSIVRWTAPNNGRYDISATFSLRDNHPTTTDVAVLVGGTQAWEGAIDGVNTSQTFSQTAVVLSMGETIDFHVGFGSDGNYFFDATGLDAMISQEGLSANGLAVGAREGAPFSGPVAVVTDGNFDDRAAIFTATIDWGDGTTPAAGQIAGGGGTLIIRGNHTYAEEGAYNVAITVHRPGGASASTTTTAVVTDPPVILAGGATLNAQEGSDSGMQTVATFTDPGGVESIGDYAATINWGDAQSSGGVITLNNGVFSVEGEHTYAEEGAYTVSVTVFHDVATPATATSTANVGDPPVVGAGVSVTAGEGAPTGPVTVATFTDPAGTEGVADYGATINWGDNTSSAGVVAFDPNLLTFTVQGAHQYAEEGAYPITVTVHHDQAADVTFNATATVTDVSVAPTGGFTLAGIEGSDSGMQPVATFADPAGSEAAADYSATIDWGDGAPASPGTVAPGAGGFTVLGSHLYPDEGSYVITVTIHHDSAPDVTTTSSAVVTDAAIAATGGFSITGTEGSSSATQTVATFTDSGGPEALGDYAANINWGDGQTSSGVITLSNNVFSVTGSHFYAEEGTHPISITINHDGLPPVVATSSATISDPSVQGAGVAVTATEGVPAGGVVVATFTDPGGAENTADYSAAIDWGDGTTSAGTISASGGSFAVSGTHTYTEEGSHPVSVTLNHDTAAPTTVTATATIADPSVAASAQAPISAAEGASLSGVTVATFTDPAGPEALADYSATIAWGDGQTSSGVITLTNNVFTVTGDYTYTEEGVFSISVTIHHDSAADVIAVNTATVSDPPVSVAGGTITGLEGSDTGAKTLATFTDPGGAEPAVNYQASIDWGDGSTSAGNIAAAGTGFAVSGSHTYAEEGVYTIVVTVSDESGSTTTAATSAQVGDPELQGIAVNFNAVEGVATGPVSVATFTDPGGAENLANYAASIDWGDGTSTAGTITATGSTFTVTGSHTYSEEGPHAVSVNVQHDGAGGILLHPTATVGDAALTAGAVTVGAATEGGATPTSLSVPFTDVNPAATQADFTVTVDWGDGTTSAGVIVPSGSSWVAQASHQYGDEGAYPVAVTIHDDGGAGATTLGAVANVADASITPGAPSSIGSNEGAAFSGTVARYTDANASATAADFSAAIDWGDGSTSTGSIAVGAGGVVVVNGTHTYAEEGQFQLKVTLTDDGGSTAAATGTATVSDPAVTVTGGFGIAGTQSVDTGSRTVATFTDPAGAENLASYSSSIDWGDGSTSAGVITGPDASGVFTVTGHHAYATGGQFTVTVTVHHESAPDSTATSAATIAARTANAEIIFSRTTVGEDPSTHVDEVGPDGTQLHALTSGPSADSTPAWSADGTHVAFSSNRGGFLHIYVMDATGANVTQLTTGSYLDTLPSWSPDGTMIAFTSNRGGSLHIFVVNVATKAVTQLTTGSAVDEHPAWSPDGAHILFTSTRAGGVFTHIYVMKPDGTAVQALTSGSFFDDGASWSPDGARIVFSSTRGGASHIYVMQSDGTAVTALTSAAAPDTQPIFSPDGRFIAFASLRGGLLHIYVMNSDGTGIVAITSGTSVDAFPSWRSA